MPGGLASWLGDDEVAIKAKLPRRPRPPPSRAAPVIDVDAAPPAVTAEGGGGGKTNRLQAPTEKEAWDPFSSKGTREDASQNAFALLRKGAAARHPTAATSSASTPSPPAWREGSRPPASSWDPFGASAADEKENRGNAFSKLLAAPTSQQQHSSSSTQKGRSSFGAPGKKAKLSSGGGGSPEAGAVTRFCECPVCGKRVIIELCSKHLDTECRGLETDAGPPAASSRDSPGPGESIPPTTLPSASSVLAASGRPAARQQPAAGAPSSSGSPEGGEGAWSDDGSRAAVPAQPAAAEIPTIGDPGKPGTRSDCSSGAGGDKEASSKEQVARKQWPSADAAAVATKSAAAASRRRKIASSGAPSLRSGRKGPAGVATAAAAAGGAKTMTACPVCRQSVEADLCSWHLDNECAGVADASAARGGKGTSAGVGGNARGPGEEEGGGGSEEAAPKEGVGSEATGGLNALAAELTCPVCLCVFEDVHSLPCSHRFCLECILGCFKSSKRQECPLCKIPAWKRDLTRDVSLQNIILAYRRMAS